MTKKLWGYAYNLYQDAQYRVVRVVIHKGWQCSLHKHHSCDNTFQVVSGILHVVEYPETKYERVTVLHGASECKTVKAGIPHCFRSITEVIALETYRALPGKACDENDIERHKEGCKLNVDA